MPITDPESIRLSNEVIRPLSERMRGLIFELQSLEERIARVLPSIPNDPAEIVEDGRESEGVTRLTGADVHVLVGLRNQILASITAAQQSAVLKACVRPLRVE